MAEQKQGVTVTLQTISKRFGENTVLNEVNLAVAAGEFVALVGQSGCGKSTMLRLISYLDKPSAGRILIDGAAVEKINPAVRYLFQESRLLPWKNVWENVAIGSSDRSKEKTLTALQEVNLTDKADVWPALLSGGQKQRVSLARALVGEPKVLLLDEPLGALDALTRIQMQILIEKLWKEQGFTVILVTHDVSEAVYLADRVILLEEGKVVLDKEIPLARPRVRDKSYAYYEQLILKRVMRLEETQPTDLYTI